MTRYAMIMAGGSGTRLWPMSTADQPKQLIPFIKGRSLIQIAMDRLNALIDPDHQLICAGESHRKAILSKVPGVTEQRYFGEPQGRDTLNAIGFVAAVLAKRDPSAVLAVFTADHVIQPVDQFQRIVDAGYKLAESSDNVLVTFGITPTQPATGYGYLQLGKPITGHDPARIVEKFKEKPDQQTAQRYFDSGPSAYLWNSGMFVWRAATLMRAIENFAPDNFAMLKQIADAYDTPRRAAVISDLYPKLPKISVDFAIMEKATASTPLPSRERSAESSRPGEGETSSSGFTVAALPMPLQWLDVGSWPSYALTVDQDASGNSIAAPRTILLDSANTLIASNDPQHLITTIGVTDLVIIHTPRATLICHRDHAQRIKDLHKLVADHHGKDYL